MTFEGVATFLVGAFLVLWGALWVWQAPNVGDPIHHRDDFSDDPELRAGKEVPVSRRGAIGWRVLGVAALFAGVAFVLRAVGIDVGSFVGIAISEDGSRQIVWALLAVVFGATGLWLWRSTDRIVRALARQASDDAGGDFSNALVREGPSDAVMQQVWRAMRPSVAVRLASLLTLAFAIVMVAGVASPGLPLAVYAALESAESVIALVVYATVTVGMVLVIGNAFIRRGLGAIREALGFLVAWVVLVSIGYFSGFLDGAIAILRGE